MINIGAGHDWTSEYHVMFQLEPLHHMQLIQDWSYLFLILFFESVIFISYNWWDYNQTDLIGESLHADFRLLTELS